MKIHCTLAVNITTKHDNVILFIGHRVRRVTLFMKLSSAQLKSSWQVKMLDSLGFPTTAGLQLLRKPCQPRRKACWEAGRHADLIDQPVASSCLFTNNKSMQLSAGGRHAWPLICSEPSHINSHANCYIEYTQAEQLL